MRDTRESFLQAYDEYADSIYRHCYFRVYSRQRAEELVQETFLKAWIYLTEGNQVGNLRAFLYRVAHNLVIDDARRHKEESLEKLLERSESFEPIAPGDPETQALANEVFRDMARLPLADREILILRYVNDLDPREIAEVLEITPNNASVRLNRALRALKKVRDGEAWIVERNRDQRSA